MRLALAALVLSLVAVAPSEATAEPSSWLSLGGGYALQHDSVAAADTQAAVFSGSLGVGSSAHAPVVVGAGVRTTTHFALGTDLSVMPRIATGGFARGDWGIALDAGVAGRFWKGGDFGRYPLQGVLLLGMPWGLQAGVGVDVWNLTGAPYARGGFAVLELDLLRFTLMRGGSTESRWPNVAPPGGVYKP